MATLNTTARNYPAGAHAKNGTGVEERVVGIELNVMGSEMASSCEKHEIY